MKEIYVGIFIALSLAACREKDGAIPPAPYSKEGRASFYSGIFTGKATSSGELYHPDSLTAAHMYLPFGTVVEVTNLSNNKSVIVAINDRGPYVSGRIVDLSAAAARRLGFIEEGVADVRLTVVKPAKGYSVEDSVAGDRVDEMTRDVAGFD